MPRRRAWQPTPVFLPGEFLGQRSLVGYSPKESDTTERLTVSLITFTGCSQRVLFLLTLNLVFKQMITSRSLWGGITLKFPMCQSPDFLYGSPGEQRCSFSWGDFSDFAEEAQIGISSSVAAIIKRRLPVWRRLPEHHCFHGSCSFHIYFMLYQASLIAQLVKNPPAMQETLVRFLGQEDPLEKEKANPLLYSWASLVDQLVKNLPAMQETWVRSPGWEDPLEKGKTTHSSILAWRIPWNI